MVSPCKQGACKYCSFLRLYYIFKKKKRKKKEWTETCQWIWWMSFPTNPSWEKQINYSSELALYHWRPLLIKVFPQLPYWKWGSSCIQITSSCFTDYDVVVPQRYITVLTLCSLCQWCSLIYQWQWAISNGVHGFKKKENKQISSQTIRAWSWGKRDETEN